LFVLKKASNDSLCSPTSANGIIQINNKAIIGLKKLTMAHMFRSVLGNTLVLVLQQNSMSFQNQKFLSQQKNLRKAH
jgi:hypothetical protein